MKQTYNKVVFYNCWGHGDIHLVRGLVRKSIKLFKNIGVDKFEFCHAKDPCLISDVNILTSSAEYKYCKSINHSDVNIKNDVLYFNTWAGQCRYAFTKKYKFTFKCLCKIFESNLAKAGINYSFDNCVLDVFPDINFSKFRVGKINKYVTNKHNLIFVSDERGRSGQGNFYSFNKIIHELSPLYPKCTFIIANPKKLNIAHNNIISASKIIGKRSNDLNESAYLSTFCKLIIGKVTGSFSYAMNKKNLYEREAVLLAFSAGTNSIIPECSKNLLLGYDEPNYLAKTVNRQIRDEPVVKKIINEYISQFNPS